MPNPLESYRWTQRELRRHFDAFTKENCPTCPTPCCRRPARILPTDIRLAESVGWRAQLPTPEIEPDIMQANEVPASDDETPETLPCEYLGAQGCTFPTDLRPFGCTTYVCQYMYARLDKQELARIRRLIRELEEKHRVLQRMLRPTPWDNTE